MCVLSAVPYLYKYKYFVTYLILSLINVRLVVHVRFHEEQKIYRSSLDVH